MRKKTIRATRDKKILTELNAQYNRNKELLKKVTNSLPDEFKLTISQCTYYQNTLTIIISSQLIASKLRYSLPQLKKQLQLFDIFCSLRKIRLQISPAISVHKQETKNMSKPVYSDKTAELLLFLSETIDNPELQLSLKKLAQHVKK
jgi:hypothetical protein